MKPFKLTPKEKEVATLLIKGETNKVISEAMGVTLATVKMHITAILEKVRASNRTGAALKIQKRAYDRRIKVLNERVEYLEGRLGDD